jgi:hypothetical protein
MRAIVFLLLVSCVSGLFAGPPVQLVPPGVEATFRQSLPVVDNDEVSAILQADDLIFYTEREMPKAYQNGSTFHSPYYNISGEPDRFGNGNREFPWGIAGGTHNVNNLEVFRFVKFPRREDGRYWPMIYFRQPLPGIHRDNNGSSWRWMFPDGTVFGELLAMKRSNGYTYPFELRLRTRENDYWAVDCYRPCPTAQDLITRVKELRPSWQTDPSLMRLITHLESDLRFPDVRLRDRSGRGFDVVAKADALPAVPDSDLVARILVESVWKTALGEDWRSQDNARVSAPTVNPGAGFHIVPEAYTAYAFSVDSDDCMQCHKHTNRAVSSFEYNRGWYGRIRGSDGIFSFHPVAHQSIATNGERLQVQMNPVLVRAGLCQPYNPAIHPATVYRPLDPQLYQEGK